MAPLMNHGWTISVSVLSIVNIKDSVNNEGLNICIMFV